MSETPLPPRGKLATRAAMLSRRDALPAAERASASARIAERAAEVLANARVVALYAEKSSEVGTEAIDHAVRARGGRVVYPRVHGDARALTFHEVTRGELVVARFGLHEPASGAPEVALADIDAFVVPGTAFDRAGGRIGWGRGHYDATFDAARAANARAAALRVGLAFECQLVEAGAIAHEPHDVAMNVVITEVATYWVA